MTYMFKTFLQGGIIHLCSCSLFMMRPEGGQHGALIIYYSSRCHIMAKCCTETPVVEWLENVTYSRRSRRSK